MSLRRSLERLRDSGAPRAVLAMRKHLDGPVGDAPLSPLQISRRIVPALPTIAREGIDTSDENLRLGLGRAIENLYKEQQNADD